jgi:hypothetical protein
VLLVALGLLVPGAARADESLDETSPEVSHKRQFGFHAKMGTGYRAIFPYGDEYCGSEGSDNDFCPTRAPLFLDVGLSYRVTDKLDVLLEMRLGLEKDFGRNESEEGSRNRLYSPGLKLYFREGGTMKVFSTLQFVIDTTDYPHIDEIDYAVKNVTGLQIDPHKTMGVFFFFGETVGWSRWLRFEMEGGLGLQARFP